MFDDLYHNSTSQNYVTLVSENSLTTKQKAADYMSATFFGTKPIKIKEPQTVVVCGSWVAKRGRLCSITSRVTRRTTIRQAGISANSGKHRGKYDDINI